jgi:hypothetical protein
MKTINQIKKEIEEAVLSCPYNKKKDKEHRCSDCRTETDILDALLNYSNEIIEEIEKLKKGINNLENIEQRVITKSYAFLLINKFKSSIIGKEKNGV